MVRTPTPLPQLKAAGKDVVGVFPPRGRGRRWCGGGSDRKPAARRRGSPAWTFGWEAELEDKCALKKCTLIMFNNNSEGGGKLWKFGTIGEDDDARMQMQLKPQRDHERVWAKSMWQTPHHGKPTNPYSSWASLKKQQASRRTSARHERGRQYA